jgi:DNA helicase-2/ATP-dependent DNA helicase PcrA
MAYQRYKSNRTYTKPAPVARVKSTRVPSEQQRAIIDTAVTGANITVMALPGTGKSSTLEMVYDAVSSVGKRIILLAFNKAIETELTSRGLPAKTFHSLGFGSIARVLMAKNGGVRVQVDANKCGIIFDQTINTNRQYDGARSAVLKLVSLMKAHLLSPGAPADEIMALMDHFDVSADDEKTTDETIIDLTRSVLAASNADYRTVDFDDMIYLVHVHDVRLDSFDVVLVDESQDTNPARRMLLHKVSHARTQVIVVGDDNQAIYGFTGASHDSMERLTSEFQCTCLPLTVTYRCSKAVVRHAQELIPEYRAIESAAEGSVQFPEKWKLTDFRADDFIICRNNAPLIGVAYRMLSQRIPCKIMGREIGRGLIALIEKIAGKRGTLDTLPEKLEAYRARESDRMLARKQESRLQALNDKVDSILALVDTMTPEDTERGIPGLCAIIDGMFSDNGPAVTTLATVHKSKGLEAPRVFILDADLIYSKYSRQEWQQRQDRNLDVVARTRAITTLVYLDSKTIV